MIYVKRAMTMTERPSLVVIYSLTSLLNHRVPAGVAFHTDWAQPLFSARLMSDKSSSSKADFIHLLTYSIYLNSIIRLRIPNRFPIPFSSEALFGQNPMPFYFTH